MPLPLTVSCFSKIQIGFTFLVPAHLGSPGQRAIKRVCVCVTYANLCGVRNVDDHIHVCCASTNDSDNGFVLFRCQYRRDRCSLTAWVNFFYTLRFSGNISHAILSTIVHWIFHFTRKKRQYRLQQYDLSPQYLARCCRTCL